MPPKKKPNDGARAKPAPKKAAVKRGGRKMPPPMVKGESLTDFTKKTTWVLGQSIGKGGFGEIYSAKKAGDKGNYVVKIEPYENGPLFTELSFYSRVAKPSVISEWCKSHGLPYIAVPDFVASGVHEYCKEKYRFMVIHEYGEDIEKKFTANGRQFGLKTVCYLALRLLEALEFLHCSEYVHADVKGSNLLTGLTHPHQVYLVDYGLAYRYLPDGVHKAYSEDPRRKHDGTIEFTSIDAHNGVNSSRRADMEIMGYCLLQWAAGRLPWEDKLEDKDYVAREKIRYKSNVGQLMKDCFTSTPVPLCLRDFMRQVYRLDYDQEPNYTALKSLFTRELRDMGSKDDHKDLDWLTPTRKRASASVDDGPVLKKASHRKSPKVSRAVKQKSDIPPKATSPPDGPPVKKALPIKPPKAKSDSRPVKQKGSDTIIPEAAYPPEAGYPSGREAHKKLAATVAVGDEVVSPVAGLRRSARNKMK